MIVHCQLLALRLNNNLMNFKGSLSLFGALNTAAAGSCSATKPTTSTVVLVIYTVFCFFPVFVIDIVVVAFISNCCYWLLLLQRQFLAIFWVYLLLCCSAATAATAFPLQTSKPLDSVQQQYQFVNMYVCPQTCTLPLTHTQLNPTVYLFLLFAALTLFVAQLFCIALQIALYNTARKK